MRNDHIHTTLRSMAVMDLLAPDGPSVPIEVELRYDSRDPYAIIAAFRSGPSRWVKWCFARELLADGLLATAGIGDVRIGPTLDDGDLVDFTISSPTGLATFEAYAQDLADFLDRTYDLVPLGDEGRWVTVDDALATLLSSDFG